MLPAELPLSMARDLMKDQFDAGKLLLAQAAHELGNPGVSAIELEGPAAERIAEVAERDNYDLVVVGSRGRNAVARLFLGSVADRLVHICKKPVLVAR